MKRLVFLFAAVVLLMAAFTPSAFAGWSWCEDDPLVKIVTPAGNRVNVHVTNYAWANSEWSAEQKVNVRAALKSAKIAYTVESVDGASGTEVVMTVEIPRAKGDFGFSTRSVVSTLPHGLGVVYDTADGQSGETIELRFSLNVP
ncbi:MAG: hypothetical protein Q7O66_08810 [Dehalococcoidia bacterium]|nr:hypothetical protein [Dehalococcoidia bacterium]